MNMEQLSISMCDYVLQFTNVVIRIDVFGEGVCYMFADWLFCLLVQNMKPSSYPQVFGHSLEATFLLTIVEAFLRHGIP